MNRISIGRVVRVTIAVVLLVIASRVVALSAQGSNPFAQVLEKLDEIIATYAPGRHGEAGYANGELDLYIDTVSSRTSGQRVSKFSFRCVMPSEGWQMGRPNRCWSHGFRDALKALLRPLRLAL